MGTRKGGVRGVAGWVQDLEIVVVYNDSKKRHEKGQFSTCEIREKIEIVFMWIFDLIHFIMYIYALKRKDLEAK